MSDAALFERDFIERTYPSIVSDVSTAFAELVAKTAPPSIPKITPHKNLSFIINPLWLLWAKYDELCYLLGVFLCQIVFDSLFYCFFCKN